MIDRESVVFVTGHRGLVGSAVVRHLEAEGFTNVVTAARDALDLRDPEAVADWFKRREIDYVIHCAGKVGGILANSTEPADFWYDNQLMAAAVLRAAQRHGVKKLLFLGSSCIYPRDCEQPIREESLLNGALEPTNDAYAIAKISGILGCQAYRRQHGCSFISAMPTNLYGPNDNFDLTSSHVLPALLRKMHEAKILGADAVTVWGTGTPRREFLHVDDLAAACLFLLEEYDSPEPINVGTGVDITIRDLAMTIREIIGFSGEIVFDDSKPDGTPRKQLDVSRITDLGWSSTRSLVDGVKSTYQWFLGAAADETASIATPTRSRWWESTSEAAPERFVPRNGKRALLTGITGQDGSYLAELLISKGYEVWGIIRRSSSFNTARLDGIYQDPHEDDIRLHLRYGDLADSSSLNHILEEVRPDEIYNLGAQSHVKVSFEVPEYTADVTALGAVRLLEGTRKLVPNARFYQASSSELYGKVRETPQSETTPFHPRSPYAVAKQYAFDITRNYREAYGMFAVNGILFNHESPRRGETFVTRKITRSVARIVHGELDTLYLGNLDAKRDWGFAGDYVEAMWLMLQAESPQDFVIATGETHTVREFCNVAFRHVGLELCWEGEGTNEVGIAPDGRVLVRVDPQYFRPAEVELLLGDASKAKRRLGWEPLVGFEELVEIMVDYDMKSIWPGVRDGSGSRPIKVSEGQPNVAALQPTSSGR